jgi:hypothetical protein
VDASGDWNTTITSSLPEPFASTRMEFSTVTPDASVTS